MRIRDLSTAFGITRAAYYLPRPVSRLMPFVLYYAPIYEMMHNCIADCGAF